MIEDILYSRLSSASALTALVGDRIYPVVLPKNCPMPAIILRRAKTDRESLISSDSGEVLAHFEMIAWAPTYTDARAAALPLRQALQRWQDEVDGVNDIQIIDEFDDFESETQLFGRVLVAEIDYQE